MLWLILGLVAAAFGVACLAAPGLALRVTRLLGFAEGLDARPTAAWGSRRWGVGLVFLLLGLVLVGIGLTR